MNHICHFCNGERPHDGTKCLGCGSPIANCKPPGKGIKKQRCPLCNDPGPHVIIADERFKCRSCSAVLEKQDFAFVDDRPFENELKKEAAEEYESRQGRRGVR